MHLCIRYGEQKKFIKPGIYGRIPAITLEFGSGVSAVLTKRVEEEVAYAAIGLTKMCASE
jgi:hypothetical protein